MMCMKIEVYEKIKTNVGTASVKLSRITNNNHFYFLELN